MCVYLSGIYESADGKVTNMKVCTQSATWERGIFVLDILTLAVSAVHFLLFSCA